MKEQGLALFDFDGTITRSDSLAAFIIFVRGKVRYYLGLLILSPMLVMFKIGWVDRQRAKEMVMSYFFKSMPIEELDHYGAQFAKMQVPLMLHPGASRKLRDHLKDNDRVVVVTASPECWVKPWANAIGLECLGTRLEVMNGKFTGKFEGKNCHGDEKVCRICAHLDPQAYSPVYTYGDSKGDIPMLMLGDFCFYKPFKLKGKSSV